MQILNYYFHLNLQEYCVYTSFVVKNRYNLNNIKKNISINVTLDANQLPEEIVWEANNDMAQPIHLKSLFVAGWDEANRTTATLSIWTKDLRKDEMQQTFVQSIMTLATSYEKATGDKGMVTALRKFIDNYKPSE